MISACWCPFSVSALFAFIYSLLVDIIETAKVCGRWGWGCWCSAINPSFSVQVPDFFKGKVMING